ncbi:MAG: hypothetical protein Ct9H300mP13_8470 [Gammaproteobacteria bacterium]|nr:MAG: hypothetical protein Ct9H300mP13_8470 [Gammaproteobacteria bacterium]
MAPETTHEQTFCWAAVEDSDGRFTGAPSEGGVTAVTALKQVVDNHGVTHMAAICAICKSQFSKVLPPYGFDMDMIVSVHQLVGMHWYLTRRTD